MPFEFTGRLRTTIYTGAGAPANPVPLMTSPASGSAGPRYVQNIGASDVYISGNVDAAGNPTVTTSGATMGRIIKGGPLSPPDEFADPSSGQVWLTAAGAYSVCVTEVY